MDAGLTMPNLERWTDHSPMSDPVNHAAAIADLPSNIGMLNGIVQGVLVHSDWLTAYGLDDAHYRTVSRATLPVAERLDSIFERTRNPFKSHGHPINEQSEPAGISRSCCAPFCAEKASPRGCVAASRPISAALGKIIGFVNIGMSEPRHGS
jgi:hypothetical protein